MDRFLQVIVHTITAIVFLFIMTRLMGKKQISQISFFDYVAGIAIGLVSTNFSVAKRAYLSPGAFQYPAVGHAAARCQLSDTVQKEDPKHTGRGPRHPGPERIADIEKPQKSKAQRGGCAGAAAAEKRVLCIGCGYSGAGDQRTGQRIVETRKAAGQYGGGQFQSVLPGTGRQYHRKRKKHNGESQNHRSG